MKKGLAFGKYWPMTVGHEYYLKESATKVDELTIIVCGNETQRFMDITPRDRHIAMIRFVEDYIPNGKVIFFDDIDMPQGAATPEESLETSSVWAEKFKELAPGTTHVCTSERYGDEVAEFMGIEHICIDEQRSTVNISATMIRNDVFQYWHMMNEYMQKCCTFKVCVYGPESCGKTTVAKKLAKLFDAQFIPEHARMILPDMNLTKEVFEDIAIGQYARVFEAPPEKLIQICDTDLNITTAYAEWYLNNVPNIVSKLQSKEKYDLYVMLAPTVEWVNDGLRDIHHDNHRQYMFQRLLSSMKATGTPYVIIDDKNYSDRLSKAVERVGVELFKRGLQN
ncbi:P-loop containing nucleoside triphosphate hydrolase [Vibrio phage 2.275.O._10N.286.54.E11]|nr:P-loop containing nucleoside triphosphate hydrolase [Vibrio phage 2.275.O._10N.286.54.E11]